MSAASFCRNCGKAFTEEEKARENVIYCAACAPAAEPAPPPRVQTPATGPISPLGAQVGAQAPPAGINSGISPGLAFLLGLLPGVGAIYNAQYAKGLIHVVVFGLLASLAGSDDARGMEPFFAMLLPAWVAYMAFEAYHTAKRRQAGETVDEFSSLIPQKGRGFPVAPVLMIATGILFLLNNLGFLRFYMILRWWPVLLIALGVYLLYARLSQNEDGPGYPGEVSHERQ